MQAAVEQAARDVEDAFVAQWSLMGRWPGDAHPADGAPDRHVTRPRRLGAARTSAEGVGFAGVGDEAGLTAYGDLMMRWRQLAEAERAEIVLLSRHWSGERAAGRRWLASIDGRHVGKGYLSLAGPPQSGRSA